MVFEYRIDQNGVSDVELAYEQQDICDFTIKHHQCQFEPWYEEWVGFIYVGF